MSTVFMICAIGGGVILIIQLAVSVFGLDADMDTDLDTDLPTEDSTIFFGILSFKALVAAAAFFGLGGLAGQSAGFGAYASLMAALLPAAVAMIGVAWLMQLLHRLDAKGNVDIRNAVGATGTVYLSIPARREGPGKVTVSVQGRSMEYPAYTAGDAISTGVAVEVIGVTDAGALDVRTAGKEEA